MPGTSNVSPRRYGTAPTSVTTSQVQPTAEKTSRARTVPGTVTHQSRPPAPREMVPEISNAAVSRFVDPHSTRAPTNMPNEIAATAMPMTCSVVLSIFARPKDSSVA